MLKAKRHRGRAAKAGRRPRAPNEVTGGSPATTRKQGAGPPRFGQAQLGGRARIGGGTAANRIDDYQYGTGLFYSCLYFLGREKFFKAGGGEVFPHGFYEFCRVHSIFLWNF